jgi:hypothetical protein
MIQEGPAEGILRSTKNPHDPGHSHPASGNANDDVQGPLDFVALK